MPVALVAAPSAPAPIAQVVLPAAVASTAAPALAVSSPSARSSLEQALAELLPAQSPPGPQQVRVQLGFRDGTSTTLEPGSTQALALEELAQSLTRRD